MKGICALYKVESDLKDTAKYPDWSDREYIKVQLKMNNIVILLKFGYPSITQDEVCKNVLEEAENFKKHR